MPQALTCDVIISGVSTRSDGGLSIRLLTPELSSDEKSAVFDLQNCELKMLLQKEGENLAKLTEVKNKFDKATKSQRLRAVMFIEFKQLNLFGVTFDEYYNKEMEKIIESRKEKLQPI